VKVLAITVVVLAVLFTLTDRIAVHYADKEAVHLAQAKYGYGNTTDGYMNVSIQGFPFLTQAAGGDFGHVTLTAGNFYVDTTGNAQGGYLNVSSLRLDLNDVNVTSLVARSAEANFVTGTLTLSYNDLSGVATRLMGSGGSLRVSQALGSDGQAARVKVSGTVGGTALNSTGTVLAQGDEISLTVPGVDRASSLWPVNLPQGVGFTRARSTADGVEISLTGHQVTLGSPYGR
jgi:hypothetical protein